MLRNFKQTGVKPSLGMSTYTSASYEKCKSTESTEMIFEATMMSVSSSSFALGHPNTVRSQTDFFKHRSKF